MNETNLPLNLTFRPHPFVRNRHIQSAVSSMHPYRQTWVERMAQEMMIDVGDGVRLQGFYSPHPDGHAKGMVLLLHGWLGHANAMYNMLVGEYLYQQGYSIFRLNLRDHGDTHQLNPGVFRGDLLDETLVATHHIASLEPDRSFHMIGFSLGGNFVLRMAWRHTYWPIPNLNHTLAICPVMDPHRVTLAIDKGLPLYLIYFRQKWRRAYRQKMAAFPDRYNFSEVLTARTCMGMTRAFSRYTPYPDAETYLSSYTITPHMMTALKTPTTILCAADDPIVPLVEFDGFHNVSRYLRLIIQPYGGHVGFFNIPIFRLWIAEAAQQILENQA